MKFRPILTASLAILCPAFAGCAGTTRTLTNTGLAALGGAAGNHFSDGNPLVTAAGAGAGVLLGETINYANQNTASKARVEGYNKGRSDAVKQQYWVQVNQQKGTEGKSDEHTTLFEIPLPEQQIDGAILEPTTRVLPIHE